MSIASSQFESIVYLCVCRNKFDKKQKKKSPCLSLGRCLTASCAYIYMHACIHTYTYIHTYMHACMNTYLHICTHACMHTYIHTYMHACMHTYIQTYIYLCIFRCVNSYILAYPPPCILAYLQATASAADLSEKLCFDRWGLEHLGENLAKLEPLAMT